MGKGGDVKADAEASQCLNLESADSVKKTKDATFGLNGKLAFAIAAAALGAAFQHGFNTGVINNPQQILENWISQISIQRTGENPTKGSIKLIWSVIVSVFCLGGMMGGALTGVVADRVGRKTGLLLNNIFVLIAVLFESLAKCASSYELLIVGRFFIGVNSGLNAGLTPMYLNEISPLNLRGAIGTVYQLVITISILISQILGLQSGLGTPDLWPVLLAMTIIPAIFQVCTLPFCPESPKFLLAVKNREEDAQKALVWLRGSAAVQDEMEEIKAEVEVTKSLPEVTITEMMKNTALRTPLIIVLTIMLAQQFSGINAVIYFSSDIFKSSGLSEENATYATLAMGLINVIMTIISLVLVEKAGRKTLLLIGFAGMTIDTILLTIGLSFVQSHKAIGYICIILVLLFVIMFATGPGSIPWFLVTEFFNQSARPTASSLAVCVNWTANFIVGLSFLPLKEVINHYVFIIFVVLQALFTVFIYMKVPETKNKSLEEVSALFRQQTYN